MGEYYFEHNRGELSSSVLSLRTPQVKDVMFQFVSLNGSRKGPDLLKPLSEACFVKFSDTEAMTIGGVTENYLHPLETFIYSTETEAWSYGPTLDTDEFDPGMWNEDKGRVLNQACGLIVDTENSET